MSHMNCERALSYLPLFLYGELSFDEDEALQVHLGECPECRLALEKERTLHLAFDGQDAELPAGLLASCREELSRSLAAEPQTAPGWSALIQRWLGDIRWAPEHLLRPAGAMALLAIGFWAGHSFVGSAAESLPFTSSSVMSEPVASQVRHIEPDGSGRFQIVLDETRQRVVSGTPQDEMIRRLLTSALSDSTDPGLRGTTVEILASVPPCDETRSALMQALSSDPNDGVRLRALEGLRPLARQGDVRKVLARVLLNDKNAGVRTKAIELLTDQQQDVGREHEFIGVFQDLLSREPSQYIRMRAERQLQQAKASTEVY
jgi:hypothetical protein